MTTAFVIFLGILGVAMVGVLIVSSLPTDVLRQLEESFKKKKDDKPPGA
jgi:uncharacterized membrane protein SpoIIM required for sporulation